MKGHHGTGIPETKLSVEKQFLISPEMKEKSNASNKPFITSDSLLLNHTMSVSNCKIIKGIIIHVTS